jgi:hypothetical protein
MIFPSKAAKIKSPSPGSVRVRGRVRRETEKEEEGIELTDEFEGWS